MIVGFLGLLVVFVVSLFIFSIIDIGLLYILNPCSVILSRLEFIFQIDSTTLICFSMLFICSFLAFIYCFHYYYGDVSGFSLFYLMLWFVAVMFILVSTGSLIVSLILWEYLGFVSFLLILFYSNSSSVRASIVTLFCSRFGDVGLFAMIAFMVSLSCNLFVFFFFFLLVVVTKSASFPFISWLLEAMRAPTPVSSLVHSSTLVAAGVWFLVRYGYLVSSSMMYYLFVLSLLSIFVTGVCAIFFLDLKKIVALSTCNNISWCVLYYTCGDDFMVLFQLIVHGVSKCLLFILVGDLMSSSGSSQSLVGLYFPRYSGVAYCSLIAVLIFGLCGLPFLGIYFSKHLFFSGLASGVINIIINLLVVVGFCVSYIYSFRLFLMVSSRVRGLSSGYLVSFFFCFIFLIVGLVFGYLLGGWFLEFTEMSCYLSFFFLFIQVLGCFLGFCFYNVGANGWFWNAVLWGNDLVVGMFYSLYREMLGFSLLGIFRYEVNLLGCLSLFVLELQGLRFHLLALNFIVLGLLFLVVYSFCLGGLV